MQIKRFKKLKNGFYEIYLETDKFLLHEDLILKYELLLKKFVTDDERKKMEIENEKYAAYELALSSLENKLRTKKEMEEFLHKKGFSLENIEGTVTLLLERGYLDEKIYAESYMHDRILFSSDGPLKIKDDLVRKGIDSNIISSLLISFSEDLERERVEKIVSKQSRSNRSSNMKFLQKMKYNLGRLGYHSSVIDYVLSSLELDDSKARDVEYQKIYNKLSKKYSGKELEWKVKQKMYQKGFSIDL